MSEKHEDIPRDLKQGFHKTAVDTVHRDQSREEQRVTEVCLHCFLEKVVT